LDDLSLTSVQDLFQESEKQESEEEEQQVLLPHQAAQCLSSSPINCEPVILPASSTLPSLMSSKASEPIHTKIQNHRNPSPKLSVSRQQALEQSQAISKQTKKELAGDQPISQELSSQVVQINPDQTVTFYQEEGTTWKARIDEQYGSLRKSQVLPVYLEGLSLPTHLQPSQVHIVEINRKYGKKAVYVGSLGLPGGMINGRLGAEEIILFCGNPGVGKSALCNSIFQEPKFHSGLSSTGLTKSHQYHIFQNRMYIDTPGLADMYMKEEAAQEVEAALKKKNNYKIIFVVTLESARIRPQDIESVNAVCEAIHTPFEYGLIINKVTANAVTKVQSDMGTYLSFLTKKPSSVCIIKKDSDMEDAENALMNSAGREVLVNFINSLQANEIQPDKIKPIDTRDYKEKVEELEHKLHEALSSRPSPEINDPHLFIENFSTIGIVQGALIGGMVGGPVGAAVGAFVGSFLK
jgi:GTP-binding protein EngB required for normal cell division